MEKVFLHIPHSSVFIPEAEIGTYQTDLQTELRFMTDWYTDELFDVGPERLVFPVSRLVCDVERFRDDRDEEMAKVGMGAVYTAAHDLRPLRTVTDEKRETVLKTWYDPHHRRLERMTDERLRRFGECLIIDCHSFSGRPLPYEKTKNKDRPDVCIGTDPFHTPQGLADGLISVFRQAGLNTAFNAPFSGCMIPIRHYRRDTRVRGVMIEINRDLYLDGNVNKGKDFEKVRDLVGRAVRRLSHLSFRV